jgi:hypothetical protein
MGCDNGDVLIEYALYCDLRGPLRGEASFINEKMVSPV